mmetsp:Transcript_22984/g.54542  ORF Transcript_22984/g.54542 Transcript_22984/m.54542 type:complete len:833 (+) Transcript_22984:291-2789(+)
MQLLNSRAVPGAEFASFSVLLRSDNSSAAPSRPQHPLFGVEPVLFANPLSTVSQTCCVQVLAELHTYINNIVRASQSNSNKPNRSSSSTIRSMLLQDDENLLSTASSNTTTAVQIFRTQHGNGLALHYRVVRDKKRIAPLLSLLFMGNHTNSLNSPSSNKTSEASSMKQQSKAAAAAAAFISALEKEVTGVVFCVGVSGLPTMYCTSSLTSNLGTRMKDCLEILQRTPQASSLSAANSKSSSSTTATTKPDAAADLKAVQSLVTTLLLTEDEDRMTNSMAAGNHRLLISQDDKSSNKKTQQQQQQSPLDNLNAIEPDDNPLHFNSADHARLVVERLAILSVCQSDTTFRRFEGRSREGTSKKRSRKSTRDADLDGFDYRGENGNSSSTTRGKSIGSHLDAVASVNTSSRSVGASSASVNSGPSTDNQSTSHRSLASSTKSPGLALRGPRKDTTSRSSARAKQSGAPLLAAPTKDSGSRNRRSTSVGQVVSNFPSGGSSHSRQMPQSSMRSLPSDAVSFTSGKTPPGSITSRSQNQGRQQQQFDPFQASQAFDTAAISETAFGQTSNGNHGSTGTKVLVNIALNEDLTCFYKLSKMSSCSVEGVVQVQVQTNVDQGVPFFLTIRDPSQHIQSVQENKKFADNMADSIQGEHPKKRPDYMFTVSVPRSDNYFPVMRYKCGTDLRPVPIRVQTRVREEDDYVRVALQISSNPHNEDNLTDLTIIMGVPPVVIGETLTTSPAGGVWNASKRSVIWCVSELGGGEKFQLQARFEIDHEAPVDVDEGIPKFPVLVRCQCMHAQLSDIEVDVRDIPQVVDAEIRMKLARRFRLSHRERP